MTVSPGHDSRLTGAAPDDFHHILVCLLLRFDGGVGLGHLTAEELTSGILVVHRGTTQQVSADRHSGYLHRHRYRLRGIPQVSQRPEDWK